MGTLEHETAGTATAIGRDAALVQSAADSTGYRAWVLFVLTLVATFGFVDRIVVQILVQPIKADLHVTDAQMGLLGGLTFAVLYSLLSIPIARFAERSNRIAIISLGTALWSIATALSGVAANFGQLVSARIGVGIGEAAGGPATSSVIADYFPARRRGTAMAVYALAVPAGAFLGGSLGGAVATHWGWRVAFLCAGLPGLALAALQFLTVREPVRGRYDERPDTEAAPLIAVMRRIVGRRSLRHMIIGATLSTIGGYALNYFVAAYFARQFGLSYGTAGLIIGLVSGLPAAASIAAGGILADHLGRRSPAWYALTPAIGALLAGPLYALTFAAPSWGLATMFLVATAMCQYAYIPAAASLTQNMMRPRMRASAAALTGIVYSLLGQGLGPLLLGMLSDALARENYAGPFAADCTGATLAAGCAAAEAHGLQLAMMIFPIVYVWSAFHLAWAARYVAEDLRTN